MTIQSASTARTGLSHVGAVRADPTSAGASALTEVQTPSTADARCGIDESEQLMLSKNVLLGNFTGMTTVQIQAMKLVDPTVGLSQSGAQARIPENAWSDRRAEPKRGLLGRLRDAFGAAVKGFVRPRARPATFDTNPELRFTAIRSSVKLRASFASACQERHCMEELVALDAAEAFLAQPDKGTFKDMAVVAGKSNLPDDLLRRLERQQASAAQPLPFNRPAAVKLFQDIQANLKNLLSDNIVQDPKLRGKHGLDDATLLAELRQTNRAAG